MNNPSAPTVRLNKYISESGHCSRREADGLIENGRVKVNGKVANLGTRVGENDHVAVDGMAIHADIKKKSDRIYIAYNKPVGITCTTESNVDGNIVDAVDHDERVFPIGRLDKPSEGLILLTNDGDIVNKVLRAENSHDKEYLVSVDRPISSDFAGKMSGGIPILGTITTPCKVTVVSKTSFKIILTQGLNRQIRRMCEYLGYQVTFLKRLRIMNIELGNLRTGQWRNLTKSEMRELNDAIQHSKSEAEPVKKKPRTPKASRSNSRKTESKSFQPSKGKSSYGAGRKKDRAKQEKKNRKQSAHGKPNSRQNSNSTNRKSRTR